MKIQKPTENRFKTENPQVPQVEIEIEVRYTVVIINSFFGPDSDPPSHTYVWLVESITDYGDACNEAKAKAFEAVTPGDTLIAYREMEKPAGTRTEYEVLYEIFDAEHCIRICLTTEYGDADFREWEE